MGGDHNALAGLDGGRHGLVPERQYAGHGVFEALGQGDVIGRQLGVAHIGPLTARIGGLQRGRGGVIAAAPEQNLRVAILLGHIGLVQALKGTVMALIQPPAVHHREPGAVHLVERVPQGAYGALEHAGIGDVKFVTFCLELAPGVLGLFDAGGGQVHIGPPGETVFQIPGGFAVANENEFVHGEEFYRCENRPQGASVETAHSKMRLPREVTNKEQSEIFYR